MRHVSKLKSFIQVGSDNYYPIQNLPYSTGKVRSSSEVHCLSRIGDFAIDLTILEDHGYLPMPHKVFNTSTLNNFMSHDRSLWQAVRSRLQDLLSEDNSQMMENFFQHAVIVPLSEVKLTFPVNIGDYTDFFCSKYHAFNGGTMARGPEKALNPNWLRMPIGYHSRSSSVVIQGDVKRPRGQICPPGGEPEFTACKKLDYEVEIGYFIGGKTNKLGEPIDISQAYNNIFGLVLLNDWSARDIQAWEYVPLGPFNAKNFQTTISPWIVTLEALEPFRVPLPAQDPVAFPYLQDPNLFSYDIDLKTFYQTSESDPSLISTTNMKHLYWSITQQLTHHTVTGCNLRPGDLLGTGTLSGPTEDSLGCLLELTLNGKKPFTLPNGEKRTFLEDGDSVTIIGECKGQDFTIGFELPKLKVLPALKDQYA